VYIVGALLLAAAVIRMQARERYDV
jgi:hypothetical protein